MRQLIVYCIFFVLMQPLVLAKNDLIIDFLIVGKAMNYTERDQVGEILDTEKSMPYEMPGFELRVAYDAELSEKSFNQFEINFLSLSGETDYLGGVYDVNTQSFTPYPSYPSKTLNYIYDFSLDYAYSYALRKDLYFISGVGLGYRLWWRELSPSQVEVYRWGSIRPKVGFSYLVGKIRLEAEVEYQLGFDTKMDVLANAENSQKTFNLGFADITQLGFNASYNLANDIDLLLEYCYEEQIIGASNSLPYSVGGVVQNFYEPDSTAHNHYVKIGASFRY